MAGPETADGRKRASRGLAADLRARLPEIEGAALVRVQAVANPREIDDLEYAIGLRDAVGAALEYALQGIEAGGQEHTPLPDRLLAQARAAARNGVSLDTVLRRYSAGYALLDDFLIRMAGDGDLRRDELTGALQTLAALFDHLLAAVSVAHTEECERRLRTAARRRAEQVKGLLAGEPVDSGELNYRLDAWHLGLVAEGPGAAEAIRDLSAGLGRSFLAVSPGGGDLWAWLGGRGRLSARETLALAERTLPAEVRLALGESGRGIEAWRLTHRQAKAAMPVARRAAGGRVRYAEVALLATALGDDLLVDSLRATYIDPLVDRGRGGVLLEALDAYFSAGRNVSAAAAALGLSRQTVNSRLRAVEERVGRPLAGCAAEVEMALRLAELSNRPAD